MAQKWLEMLVINTSANREPSTNFQNAQGQLLRLNEGHVRVFLGKSQKEYDGEEYWASHVQVQTESKKALDRIIDEGKHPYWFLEWCLKDNLNISSIVSHVKELLNKEPSSTSTAIDGFGNSILTSAIYNDILSLGENRIEVRLSGENDQEKAKVGIVWNGKRNSGFFQAQTIFSPDDILSILYAKISSTTAKKMVRDACVG
jgi:hypothetical protein